MDNDSNTPTWNNQQAWIEYVTALTPVIQAIAAKYTTDHHLREDAVQNALIELLEEFPEKIRGYEKYTRGEITEERWQETLRSFCLTLARNEILSTLASYSSGNMYLGRTQVMRAEDKDGQVTKVRRHVPARYVSLDTLVVEHGLQIADNGEFSWPLKRHGGNEEEEPDI